eukprot:jgi/Mesvir1/10644/Mv13740-RA.1
MTVYQQPNESAGPRGSNGLLLTPAPPECWDRVKTLSDIEEGGGSTHLSHTSGDGSGTNHGTPQAPDPWLPRNDSRAARTVRTSRRSVSRRRSQSLRKHQAGDGPVGRWGRCVGWAGRVVYQFNAAFWTRAALVILLAAAVMGTALFVLRLYNANVYHEAAQLGREVQSGLMSMAELHMDAFVDEMVQGTLSLAGNLVGQGLVPLLLANDVHHARATRLVWETFASTPTADAVAYGLEYGTNGFLRTGQGLPPLRVQGKPDDPAVPSGPWSARMVPVDPLWGEPLPGAVVQEALTIPFTNLPFWAVGLTKPPGTVFWLISPAQADDGSYQMMYTSNSVLWLKDAGDPGAGNASSDPTNDPSSIPTGNDATITNVLGGGIGSTSGSGGGVGNESIGLWGDVDPEEVPLPDAVPPTEGYRAVGMAGVGQGIESLKYLFSEMDLQGGRLFCSSVSDGNLVIASAGNLFKVLEGVLGPPSMISADESSDEAIAAAGRHLRERFRAAAATRHNKEQREGKEGKNGVGAANAASAARVGLCWDEYQAMIHVDGRPWYLHCRGRMYGGERAPLPLVGVLLMPRDRIMGSVDASKQRTLVIVMGVSVAIAVFGILAVFLSTVTVGRLAEDNEALEEAVEQQEGEIAIMARELDAMRALLPGATGHMLDMRTPMQMVHDLLSELTEETAVPGPHVLIKIQNLLKMPEPHLPILLQQCSLRSQGPSEPGSPLPGQRAGDASEMLDADTTAWLQSTVMRLPKRQSVSVTSGNSVPRRPSDQGDDPNSPSRLVRSGTLRMTEELSLDSIANMIQQMSQGPPGGGEREEADEYSKVSKSLLALQTPLSDGRVVRPGREERSAHGSGIGGGINGIASIVESGRAGASETGEIQAMLALVGSWNFDSWQLTTVCSGHPILWMGLELFRRMGLVKEFKLPVAKLVRFLAHLDDGMRANSYHNSTHIVDVSNSLYHLIEHSGLSRYLNRFDLLAAVLAALVHDFKHPGLNNDFVVKSSDELALRYNDRTVLENYHVAEAFLLLSNADLNFLEGLPRSDFNYVRNVVIEMVLGSDLKRHFEILEQFNKRIKDKDKPLSKSRDMDRLLLLQMALKVADIGHSAKKLAIHKVWTHAITQEFYLQGDKEKAAGFKVSPFMDREHDDLAKSQLGFFSFIAHPLVDSWVLAFPEARHIMEEMSSNIQYWENRRVSIVVRSE